MFGRKAEPKNDKLCEHTSHGKKMGLFSHLVLLDGHHTGFAGGRCDQCGRLWGFPDGNLKLAIRQGTKETLDFLGLTENDRKLGE